MEWFAHVHATHLSERARANLFIVLTDAGDGDARRMLVVRALASRGLHL